MTGFKRITISSVPAKCAHSRQSFIISAIKKPGKLILVSGNTLLEPDKKQNFTKVSMSGKITFDSDYCCPVCSNKSIVRCKECGSISCYDESGYFTCANCSAEGFVCNTLKGILLYS
jgi:hypothetical protein